MIKILVVFGICFLAAASDHRPTEISELPGIRTLPESYGDPDEESALTTGRFFFPVNPQMFTAWRRKSLTPRRLFPKTDPLRFDTLSIHATVSSIVFPGASLQRIMDTFRISNDTSSVSPTARAVIRAIYTIRIHRDLFGPLPKYIRHDIYDHIPNFDISTHRRDVSRVLTFMFLIPRVPDVWNSWKYLAIHYKLPSVVELARIVGSIAADTRMFWFEEMFSY